MKEIYELVYSQSPVQCLVLLKLKILRTSAKLQKGKNSFLMWSKSDEKSKYTPIDVIHYYCVGGYDARQYLGSVHL